MERTRDAGRTRDLLIAAARRRFALYGYAGSTVREIAEEAGVNVALISRYFGSKEGLFEACLASAVETMRSAAGQVDDLSGIGPTIARQVAGRSGTEPPDPIPMLLLLRTSGDPVAEDLRLDLLRSFSERLAELAQGPGARTDHDVLLRAQLLLCASLGVALARSWPDGLEPLGSAEEAELSAPLTDLVMGLLSGS